MDVCLCADGHSTVGTIDMYILCICACVCAHVCMMYVCICICICMYATVYVDGCMRTYGRVHVCVCVCERKKTLFNTKGQRPNSSVQRIHNNMVNGVCIKVSDIFNNNIRYTPYKELTISISLTTT